MQKWEMKIGVGRKSATAPKTTRAAMVWGWPNGNVSRYRWQDEGSFEWNDIHPTPPSPGWMNGSGGQRTRHSAGPWPPRFVDGQCEGRHAHSTNNGCALGKCGKIIYGCGKILVSGRGWSSAVGRKGGCGDTLFLCVEFLSDYKFGKMLNF